VAHRGARQYLLSDSPHTSIYCRLSTHNSTLHRLPYAGKLVSKLWGKAMEAVIKAVFAIDEATGESWRPKESVGQPCTTLDANTSSRVWMRFDVPNPEQRTFSVSSPLLKGTLDNLVLVRPS
jgi:hypothetical protein